ncbi:MAG: bifunctional riboflavin kinase/FAD synthetase [Actinobacteria bacterium]|nr:MAG: bifunctional riboflavin kinase/FAD synthetase [Actinomycetota bacterium]
MEVINDLRRCPCPEEGSAVTIGAYDGVHLGHRRVIAEVRERAERQGLSTAVVTFDRHPAMVVRPQSAPLLLTDLEQKIELLADTGVDHVVVIAFDESRSRESAEDFVEEVLVGCLRARVVVVGRDFHFGHARRGNIALLSRMGEERGFEVVGLGLVDEAGESSQGPGEAVSSTRIRTLLREGRVTDAARLLGRPHEVRGVVQRGDARGGAELGFPTANIAVPAEILLPAEGIYAGYYERPDGSVHPAAISLGRRPTFYEHAERPVLEAYLLDFSGDLYDERAKVRFVAWLKAEERFDSPEELVAQMEKDVEATRAALAGWPLSSLAGGAAGA